MLDPVHAVAFLAVHQAVFGLYMGCSFAPNHKGMPTVPADVKMDYLRRQVLTSRNVRGGWFTDLLLGGLNYQIEHHLFPNMPRANLPKARALVRSYCAAHGITYTETTLLGSYAIVVRHLHALGAPLRAGARSARCDDDGDYGHQRVVLPLLGAAGRSRERSGVGPVVEHAPSRQSEQPKGTVMTDPHPQKPDTENGGDNLEQAASQGQLPAIGAEDAEERRGEDHSATEDPQKRADDAGGDAVVGGINMH